VLGIALVLIFRPGHEGGTPAPSREPGAATVGQQRVLARPPFLGVSCPRASSIACDRVGLAIWTLPAARAARATIAGRSFELTDDPSQVGTYHRGQPRMFVGFLHHAGLRHGPLAVQVENGRSRWTGKHPVHANVNLVITLADGSRRTASVRVPLQAGYG
jgi:hypothetical protein